MQALVERLVSRARRAADDDAGFTLIEMVVALIVFALVAEGLAGALIGSARGQMYARNDNGAKGLTQQRVDAMRSLPYHVDEQNGPFVDLLDMYFPNTLATTTAVPLPDLTSGKASGQYFATPPATPDVLPGPYYRLTISGASLGANDARYTQIVYTQFLHADNPAATPLPAASIPTTYNNGTPGTDQPPSPIVGVTVVTSWASNGVSHKFSTFTEIASQGTDATLVVAQAKSAAVLIQTQDYLNNSIVATVGGVTVNGALSSGSRSGADAVSASIADADPSLAAGTITGATGSASAPVDVANTTVSDSAPHAIGSGSAPCSGGWGAFGPTWYSNLGASVAGGLPVVPVTADGTPTSLQVTSGLLAKNSSTCGGVWFSNQVDGTAQPDSTLGLSSTNPMIRIADVAGSGPTVTGGADVYTATATGAGGAVTTMATASMNTWLKVFPGLPFLTPLPALPAGYPAVNGAPGLVNLYLTSARLTCTSADSIGNTSASLAYSGYVVWYTSAGWQHAAFSWSSASPTTDPLAVVNLNAPVTVDGAGAPVPLSSYVTSITGATAITGQNGGMQTVEGAVALGTVPTLAGWPGTTIGVELGQLSCVAQDNRS
ncbi:MAG TPA: prepilin-type N-terminal cleavage/methylation domain-containing protein [Acidothermaceae bacterium]